MSWDLLHILSLAVSTQAGFEPVNWGSLVNFRTSGQPPLAKEFQSNLEKTNFYFLFLGSLPPSIPANGIDTPTHWPKLDEPIFISPWNNNTFQQQQQQQQGDEREDNRDEEKSSKIPSSIHPFARRTKSRTFVEQKNLFSTSSTSTDSSEDPPKVHPDIWCRSYKTFFTDFIDGRS